ncbi:MAG TPA: uroporphyrinogen-III synthase [Burkholderiales bacterium]|nr:uroporphyrinogen-III synthase [Burkholderiales bacterium]
MIAEKLPLEGLGIVITRPAAQAQALVELIRDRGGWPISFPATEILDIADPTRLHALIDRMHTFDIAIFVSPNAAAKGMSAIRARAQLPRSLKVLAIGGGTARELKRHGVGSVIVPAERFDSEALLELPELAAAKGKHIVIFRGEGGRALLGDTLAARGAAVEYAQCYRRVKPDRDTGPLLDAWRRGKVHAVVATSSEGLRNLHGMLGAAGRHFLEPTPLFVPHPRIAATARELGLHSVVLAQPLDAGIVTTLVQHFAAAG